MFQDMKIDAPEKRETVNVRLPETLVKALDALATKNKVTRTLVIETLLKEVLKLNKK